MDLKASDSLLDWQNRGLALPWTFEGRAGFRLQPRTPAQVGPFFAWAAERNQRIAFSEQEAAQLPEAPVWMDTAELRQVRQYSPADFTIQVECGITMRELLAITSLHQQGFALSYPPNATLLSVLAADRPALQTGFAGYPRDYVLKTELVAPADSEATISGADVVKNVTGYDLAKLYVSGQHAFGLLTSVTLKLAPLPKVIQAWRLSDLPLSELCALVNQLLQAELPLNACELFQKDGQWQLFVSLAGDEAVLMESKARLVELHSAFTDPCLDTRSAQTLMYELQSFSPLNTVIELALPLGGWHAMLQLLQTQTAFQAVLIQVRPAAGLIYIMGKTLPYAALKYLKTEVVQAFGQMQILQIGQDDVVLSNQAQALYTEFNLPDDPVIRRLLCNLKKRYDPSGILWSPRLPLLEQAN